MIDFSSRTFDKFSKCSIFSFNGKEKKEKKENKTNDIILPIISTNNSVKIEDNYYSNKDILLSDEKNKLDDINEMMKKVIDEN